MKVQNIQQTTFCSKTPKTRYITNNMRTSIESLLLRMNNQTERTVEGDRYLATVVKRLRLKNGVIFEDERDLKKPVHYSEQMQGFSSITLDKKTWLDIDNKTGEIIDFNKPFYKPWKFVYKKAEKALMEMRGLYGLDEVQKEKLTVNDGLTPEGYRAIKKMILQFEKQRLEKVTKELEKELENENR